MAKRTKASMAGLIDAVRHYQDALLLVITKAPRESVLLGSLLVVQGLLPPNSVWLVKAVVDDVVGRASLSHLIVLVSIWAATALVAQLANQWATLVQANLTERVTAHVERLLMRKANGLPDLATFYVRLQQHSWGIFQKQNPLIRMMRYCVSVATTAAYAKEIRLYGSGSWFEGRYVEAFEKLEQETVPERRKQAGRPILAALLFVLATAFAFGWTALNAWNGRLSVGDIVLLLQGTVALGEKLAAIANMGSVLAGHLLFFDKLFAFLARESTMPVARPGQAIPRPLVAGITFDAVSYRYPNGKLALENVSFTLKTGERVALVGENGAGKSTLVKLLCRLYDPGDGRIRVDGVDLRELDLAGWRANVGTIFQDFGRYQLTVVENVTLGRQETGDALGGAIRRSGFGNHLSTFPEGLATQLGVEFGGADLSGGQWQSLAIARALLTDAEILILDEPTAALDPRAEAELFQRFAALSAGKTTVLVTHRLASARTANRILVLKDGRLIEIGNHEELLRQNGEYAMLYKMQAEQYENVTLT